MLALMMRATRSADPAPADAKFAVPERSIRVVSLDVKNLDVDRAIAAIHSVQPDIVLLQNTRSEDVERIGVALGMSRADQKSGDVFYPAQNFDGPAAPFGNAIYSRWPLYEGRSIPNRAGSFGVWAVAVIDGGAKIMIASARTTDSSSTVLGTQDAKAVRAKELAMLARAHDELGAPPILLGGKFTQAQERAFAHFGESVGQRDDQRLFAFAGRGASWKAVPLQLPDDAPGICIEAGGH